MYVIYLMMMPLLLLLMMIIIITIILQYICVTNYGIITSPMWTDIAPVSTRFLPYIFSSLRGTASIFERFGLLSI